MYDETAQQTELRDRAVKRLKKRRDFYGHVLIYTLVNAFLVVIWAVTSNADSFFWPIFPMVGWGIAVVMNAWDVYFAKEIDEEAIEREIRHMQEH
ncbi:MAG TPA: 2TM domain-containing protein [Nocardioidaceae bacterium]